MANKLAYLKLWNGQKSYIFQNYEMANKVSLPKTMKWPKKVAYLKLWNGQ